MRNRLAWFFLAVSAACAAYGQITVPAESDPYKIIEASVTASIPSGATLDGGWKIPDGVDHRAVNANTIYLVAPPGEYVLEYGGFWLHLEKVTFTDGAGNEITISSYLGHGTVNEEALFRVLGGDPGPDPPGPDPPGPNPGQKYQLMFFLESDKLDQMPTAQREIVTSLVVRKKLSELGHRFLLVVDDDQITDGAPAVYKPWIDAVRGDPLPRVAIAFKEGGPIMDFPMPASYEDLLELLKGG